MENKNNDLDRVNALSQIVGEANIVPCKHDLERFRVNPGRKLVGTSPERARELAGLVRKALLRATAHMTGRPFVRSANEEANIAMPASVDEWTSGMIRESIATFRMVGCLESHFTTYKTLEGLIRQCPGCRDLLSVGMHDLVNSLYYICGATGLHEAHESSLREAFDRLEVVDRRESVECHEGEYLVLLRSEMEDRIYDILEDELDSVEGANSGYFDRERWKADRYEEMDMGEVLASYDGKLHEVPPYFIFRVN